MKLSALISMGIALALAATVHADADAGARRFDPCIDAHEPQWSGLTLLDEATDVPRDGLLLRSQLAAPRDLTGVSLQVTSESGDVVAAELELREQTIAWRPDTALDPGASYTLAIELDNTKASGCRSAPVLEQSVMFTTRVELTPAPPEPPLRDVVLTHAWLKSPLTCCEPRDISGCSDPDSCYKCWQDVRVPLIVPRFDALQSDDNFDYEIFYGASTRGRALLGWLQDVPNGVIQPLLYPDVEFSDVIREVCLTAAARNFRTGQMTTRTRCHALDFEDPSTLGAELAGRLPPNLSLIGPTDPALEIGSPGCSDAAPAHLRSDQLQVAARYESARLDCGARCAAGSGGSTAAAIARPHVQNTPENAPRSAGGCSAAAPRAASPALLLLALGLLLFARRGR